jgi:hypothetical protein
MSGKAKTPEDNINKSQTTEDKNKKVSYKWTDTLTRAAIDIFNNEKINGTQTDSGYKTTGWNAMVTAFNAKFPSSPVDKDQLMSRYKALKCDFRLYSGLLNVSGFNINEHGGITADPQVWEDYIAHHKECSKFRSKGLAFYEELKELFSKCIATGASAHARCADQSFRSPLKCEEDDNEVVVVSSPGSKRKSKKGDKVEKLLEQLVEQTAQMVNTIKVPPTPLQRALEKFVDVDEYSIKISYNQHIL